MLKLEKKMPLKISSQLLGGLLQSLFFFSATDQNKRLSLHFSLTQYFLAFYSPYHRGFSCQPLPAVLLIERMVRQERTLQQIILNHS